MEDGRGRLRVYRPHSRGDGVGRVAKLRVCFGLILGATFCGTVAAEPPEFIDQPIGVAKCNGQTAAFSVRVDFHGGPAPALRWEFHDGSDYVSLIHGARGGRVAVVRNLSNPASATSTLTIQNVDSEVDSGDYRCVADSGAGESTPSDSALLIVYPALNVAPFAGSEGTADDSVCIDQAIQLVAHPSGGDAGQQSFVWRVLSGPDISDAQFLPSAETEDPQFVPTTPGDYFLEVEMSDGVCALSAGGSVEVTANTLLMVEPSPQNAETCVGDAVSLAANPSGGQSGYGFAWSIENSPAGSEGTFDNAAIANPKFTPTTATTGDTFDLQVILSGDACADSQPASTSITVIDGPTVESISVDDPHVCLGDATRLHVAAGGGNGVYDYAWSVSSGPSMSTSQFSNNFSAAPLFAPVLAGNYTLRASIGSGFCTSALDSVALTAHVPPNLSATISEATLCVGDSVDLTAGEVGSDQQLFTWTVQSGPNTAQAQFSDSSANNPTFTPTESGVYVLRVLLDDLLCNAFAVDTVTLTVNEAVSAAPAAAEPNGCVGSPLLLAANPSGGIGEYTFIWSVGSGPNLSSSQFNDTRAETPIFTPTAATTAQNYVLRLIVRDGVCASEEPVYFLSLPVTAPLVLESTAEDDPALLGRTTHLYANSTGGSSANYEWSVAALPDDCNDDPFEGTDTDTETMNFTPQCEGTYVVSVIADDGICDVATDSLSIEVIDYAAAPSADPDSICSGNVATLSANVTEGLGAHAYAWSVVRAPTGGDSVIDSPSDENPSFTAATVGVYGIRVEVEDDALPTISAEFDLLVLGEGPTIDAGPPDPPKVSACVGEDVELAVEASGGALSYQWRRNGFNISTAINATLSLSDVGVSDSAAYTCVVTNACGSVETEPFDLTVYPADALPTVYGFTQDAGFWNVPAGCTIDGGLVAIGIMPDEILKVTGLAADTNTGVLYAAVRTSLTPINSLATVDANTGAATVIGSMGQAISDLAFNPADGLLYAIHGNRSQTPGTVVTVNLNDASLTPTDVPPFGEEEGQSITFDEQGMLYYHGRVFGQYSRLRSVDLSSPTVVNVLHDYEPMSEWSAMAIYDNWFLAASRSTFELWSIDRESFDATVLDTTTVPGGQEVWLTGLTFLSDAPVLQLAIDDEPDPVPPGGLLTYTLTITNTGLQAATDVVLQTETPEMTSFVSERFIDGQGQSFPPAVGNTGTVTWSFSDPLLPTNSGGDTEGSAPYHVELIVLVDPNTTDGTEITDDQFQIESNETGVLQLGVSEITTVQAAAALEATLSADTIPPNGDPPGVGGLLRYVATIVNHGPPLADVDFLVSIDPNTSVVGGSVVTDGVVVSEAPVHVTIGDLGTDEFAEITFDVSVRAGMPLNTDVCHQATVTSNTTPNTQTDDPTTPAAADATCHAVCGAGDFDCSSSLDLGDYDAFQSCVRGSAIPPPDEDCVTFDFDGDGDVDLVDWSTFQARF